MQTEPDYPRPLATLRTDAVRALKRYRSTPESGRTAVLRKLAETLVEARAHYTRPDESTDWKGRSHPYRAFVRDVYDRAGIDRDESPSIQAATRYHIGEVLRSRLSDAELAEYGLQPHTPRERAADRRANRTALLQTLTSRDLAGGALYAIVAANTVLEKIEDDQLADLGKHEAEVAAGALRDIERRVRQLRGLLTAEG